jgi:mono/diheme cytochrome c family protein
MKGIKFIQFGLVLSAPGRQPGGLYDKELAVQAFQKGGCTACHAIPGVPGAVGTIGPDLSEIGAVVKARLEKGEYTGAAKTADEYLTESIEAPDAFISPACPSGPCANGLMPASLAQALSANELSAVVKYLAALPGGEPAAATETGPGESASAAPLGEMPGLTNEEFAWARQTYFERCAGCHGTLRKGATGPALTPDKTLPKGTLGLAAIIFNGTTRGMPDWGKQGVLTQAQTETLANFLQNEPPAPPELSLPGCAGYPLLAPNSSLAGCLSSVVLQAITRIPYTAMNVPRSSACSGRCRIRYAFSASILRSVCCWRLRPYLCATPCSVTKAVG